MVAKKKLAIIDSHALIHRAYHALPVLTSPLGEPVQAVYGFTSILIKVLKELKPDYAVAAFDMAGPTFRHAEFEQYKANRPETDNDLKSQFPWAREVAAALGIAVLDKFGFEADDIIGTVVAKTKNEKDLEIVIVTGDLDTLQLVEGDKITVFTLRKGINDTVIYNEKAVKERFDGLLPSQMTDYKGLRGDPSDNIPGVLGIGEKTAIELLKNNQNIENIYKSLACDKKIRPAIKEKLKKYENQAFMSKRLATIRQDAPIDFQLNQAEFSFRVNEKIRDVLNRLGFKSLMNRLSDIALDVSDMPDQLGENQGELLVDELKDYFQKGIFSEKIYKLEKELRPVLRQMEEFGFLLDAKILKTLSKKISIELIKIKKEVIKLAGENFNLNSPQELGRIIFEKLSLGAKRIKKTKTGAYSTAFDALEKIKDNHPIVPLMLRWRELSKLQSTYLEALPALVSPKDGRIHTTFKQLGAATGRLSSENPNLQNIPIKREYGLEIRKAFVARSDWLILSADYSQMELRIAAVFSDDKKMITTFKNNEDIHTRTAAEIFNISVEKVTKNMRREAKILNFGILYGMGARAFSQSAGISLEKARNFMDEYEADFVELASFIKDIKTKAHSCGYTETLWGRRRYLNDLKSPNPMLRASAERMAVNMPIQGTSADIIKAAMVALHKQINGADDIKLILQVHDELVFEIKKEALIKYASMIKKIMENVIMLKVPLVIELEAGASWGEMKKLKT